MTLADVPVFLINLEGSDQRLRAATAQLDAEGLAFERVPAFDGRSLRQDQFPDYDADAARRWFGRPLRGGEIGCYLSHLDVARRFLQTGAEIGLVFEDDLRLLPGFSDGLLQILSVLDQVLPGWDVVNLGANRHKIYTTVQEFQVADRRHALTLAHYFPMTTTALLWSRKGAQAVLSEHRKIIMPVDNYLRHRMTRTRTGLAVWPGLVTTTGVDSDISPASSPERSRDGRHPLYGLLKQRRLMSEKIIALGAKLAARSAMSSRRAGQGS